MPQTKTSDQINTFALNEEASNNSNSNASSNTTVIIQVHTYYKSKRAGNPQAKNWPVLNVR